MDVARGGGMMNTVVSKFKTIVVATDLSQHGSYALSYAQALARRHGSTLVIVHVIDPVSYAFPSGEPEELKANRLAREEVKRIEAEAHRKGIPVRSVIETGVIRERILQAAEDHHADLLVLGTRAKTQAGPIALGTVARQIIAKASCAVLTVPAGSSSEGAGNWRRVLVATDFSGPSLAALEFAQAVTQGKLLVLHGACCVKESQNTSRLEQLRLFAPFNESHTVPVEHVVSSGEAGRLIADQAREFLPDLVILGSPRNELSPDELTASTVLQAISRTPCPVLCIPGSGTKAEKQFTSDTTATAA